MTESIVTVIVPCFNEENVLDEWIPRLRSVLLQARNDKLAGSASTLLFIDNSSSDRTWEIITHYINTYREVTGLRLRHGLSTHNALLVGMESARAYSDCVITMGVDLRNDCPLIPQFLRRFNEGADIVYGVPKHRAIAARINEETARIFSKLIKTFGVQLAPNFIDFLLISRDVLEKIKDCKEDTIFLQDVVSQFSFKSLKIYYDQGNDSAQAPHRTLERLFHSPFGHYIGRLVKETRQWPRQMTEQNLPIQRTERLGDYKRVKKRA